MQIENRIDKNKSIKKIVLVRHSKPERLDLPTEQLPLSEEGRALAHARKHQMGAVDHFFSSNYQRAYETVKILAGEEQNKITVIKELHERVVGDPAGFVGDEMVYWVKQYQNHEFKLSGGESFREVGERMDCGMKKVLSTMRNGETSLVVSHAAAICAYLMKFCKVEVIDAATKARKVEFREDEVWNGPFAPLDGFVLEYEEDKVVRIDHI